jgi:TRAP-type mannitol/chloroaromatic compound transport system permease small subunit
LERFADRLDHINRAIGDVVMWAALAMVLVQFSIVLLRYIFGFTSIFINESVLYLHASIFMLGSGYTLLMNGHVRVDIFYAPLPPRKKAMIDIFGHIFLMLPSLGILLYYSWPSVRRSWSIFEGAISVGGVPASFLLKSLIPAFCVLLLVQGLSALIRDVIRLSEAK